jgi:hypothetical protein
MQRYRSAWIPSYQNSPVGDVRPAIPAGWMQWYMRSATIPSLARCFVNVVVLHGFRLAQYTDVCSFEVEVMALWKVQWNSHFVYCHSAVVRVPCMMSCCRYKQAVMHSVLLYGLGNDQMGSVPLHHDVINVFCVSTNRTVNVPYLRDYGPEVTNP